MLLTFEALSSKSLELEELDAGKRLVRDPERANKFVKLLRALSLGEEELDGGFEEFPRAPGALALGGRSPVDDFLPKLPE